MPGEQKRHEWRLREEGRARRMWRRWGYVGWVLLVAGLFGLLIGKLS